MRTSPFTPIDLATWKRKRQFEFFKDYVDPYFGITANIEVDHLYAACKANGYSFFLCSLYCAVEAANAVPEFKVRLLDGQPIAYEEVQVGCTILHDDETFSYCYFDRNTDLPTFLAVGQQRIEAQQANTTMEPHTNKLDILYLSVVPWVHFTHIKHARATKMSHGIPKIVFGKMEMKEGKRMMPVSIEVHHALMDGIHTAKFLDALQVQCDSVK